MRINNLKYQISVFGNYDEIVPNVETIKYFMELFSEKNLIPNQVKEISIDIGNELLKKDISRLRLTSSDNSWNINFFIDRIDFELTNINVGVFVMPNFDYFIEEVKDFIGKIETKYKKTHKRIGIVNNVLIDKLNTDKVQNLFSQNLPFFTNKNYFDWSNRVSTRQMISNPFEEIVNCVFDIRKIKTPLLVEGKNSLFDGLLLIIDVNSLSENNEYRFNSVNIFDYLNELKAVSIDIYNQTIDFIKK